MTCNFQVGQKVVRISGKVLTNIPAVWPALGGVYTIRAINDHGNGCVLLRFVEIDNSHMVPEFSSIEPGFHYAHFKPLVTRKTSIEIFKSMLNPSRERADA